MEGAAPEDHFPEDPLRMLFQTLIQTALVGGSDPERRNQPECAQPV